MAKYQLNVVLHGLWGIETKPDGIRIVTTEEHHHVIKAGKRFKPEHDLKGKPDKHYQLVGVIPGPPADFKADQNPTVRPADGAKPAKEHLVRTVIDLPYPREIHSVRAADTNGEQFFENNFPATPRQIAMVQVLVYDAEVKEDLKLAPLDWKPEVNPDGRTINLHLYAQPEAIHPGFPKDHFKTAYRKLAMAFDLTITPLMTTDGATPVDPGIAGLQKDDLISLWEPKNRPAGSPANCEMLVFDNGGGS
jgi:hypothetical protein